MSNNGAHIWTAANRRQADKRLALENIRAAVGGRIDYEKTRAWAIERYGYNVFFKLQHACFLALNKSDLNTVQGLPLFNPPYPQSHFRGEE